jgi:hypothetical protein
LSELEERMTWMAKAASALVLLSVMLPGAPARAAPDAGLGGPDAGRRAPDAKPGGGPDAGPADARAGTGDWTGHELDRLTRRLAEVREQTAQIGALKPSDPMPDSKLAALFEVNLQHPDAVERRLMALEGQKAKLEARIKESAARIKILEPSLRAPGERLAELQRKRQRSRYWRRRIEIPAELPVKAAQAQRWLDLTRQEHQLLQAESGLLAAKVSYLKASQPARIQTRRLLDDVQRSTRQAREAAEQAQRRARAEEVAAEKARQRALEAQRRARSEAERVLAAEDARLNGVRGKQARFYKHLADEQAELVRRRTRAERFRGKVAGRLESLRPGWPKNAAKHDALYDLVVAELIKLRPEAVSELGSAIRGLEDPPHPGDELSAEVRELDAAYSKQVQLLERLRKNLAQAADRLSEGQGELVQKRLDFLQREISWLNAHRITLLARVSPEKRVGLTSINRSSIEQLSREVTQLVFDGLYWVYKRLGQIDEVPKLIFDIFTVGSMLWTLVKLVLLLLLLRLVLRHWDDWLQGGIKVLNQSVALGRQAVRLARLGDTLVNAGPPLLVLLTAAVVFRLLGGWEGPAEVQYAYVVLFWITAYKLVMRLVEVLARHVGMDWALSGAEGEPSLQMPMSVDGEPLEGPPLPVQFGSMTGLKPPDLTPAPVLAVRSVRAATRYILVVILILELTGLAVGKGSIYRLTARFSWWAALPFVFYFLQLWRPHIQRAYQRLFRDQSEEGTLGRLVRATQDRFYGVLIIGVAFVVVLGTRLASFGRRYLSSRDAVKRALVYLFRRRVEKHALEKGRVLHERQALPEAVLRAFPMGPLSPADGPSRTEVMDQLSEVFETWKKDQSDGSAALVGRAGMGKSTVLGQLERELKTPALRATLRTKITRPARLLSWLDEVFGFGAKPSSEKELIKLIREDRRPLVALDDCHNMFLRRVGGFEAWECFMRVVNETCDNVFWLLAFNRAAFDYLNNITGHAQYLRRTLRMESWSEDAIRRDIMQKMRKARYGVSFSDLVVAQVQGVSVAAQMGRTSSGYFRMLWDFTDGTPRLASHFWLDSLVEEQDRRVMRVQLFDAPDIESLERVPADVHFVLTTIAQHQNLTRDEVVRTTGLTPDFCAFATRLCLEEGYLHMDRQTQRLRLHWRWQRPVYRFLKRKRLINE